MFVMLGVTGALLLLYYQPTYAGAFDSVELIHKDIPYGWYIRNIHYHASNGMVFLALAHMYFNTSAGDLNLRMM